MSDYPHSLDAERAVLGGVLVDNIQFDAATERLQAHHFYRDAHQRIFAALTRMSARQSVLDTVTLVTELEQAGDLESAGGPAYVAALIDGVPRSMNVPAYADIVREKAQRRFLIQQAARLMDHAREADSIAEAIDGGVSALVALSQDTVKGGAVEGPELVSRVMAYLEESARSHQARRTIGVPTGFPELDYLTDGFQPGQLVILAGRTSEGKSSLALQFALASESCVFFSCEMEVEELAVRELAVLGRVDGFAMKRGFLSSTESAAVSSALTQMAEAGVAIDDTPAVTLSYVRARARQRQVAKGLRMVVVDYLQLMTAETGKRRESTREQDVSALARGLKALAKELRVPVVALSQFNRSLKPGEEPSLSHLRESGELEQAANVVLLIHRLDGRTAADEGPVDLILAKNRGGPKGTVHLYWHPSQTRFASQQGAA